MTGLDQSNYRLEVAGKYYDNNMSQEIPIRNDRDLNFFFHPDAGLRSVDLFVQSKIVSHPILAQIPAVSEYYKYASYIIGNSELPSTTNGTTNVGVGDVAGFASGPNRDTFGDLNLHHNNPSTNTSNFGHAMGITSQQRVVPIRPGPPHSCVMNSVSKDHGNLCKNTITNKACHNSKRARENVYENWVSSCRYLPKLVEALQKYNPGTVVEWNHKDTDERGVHTLLYVFWAFKPCIEGFRHCRKVIGVDCTHLYTKYKQKMLIAVGLDANFLIIPLAYAIVDEENFRSWHWFLNMIAKHVVRGVEGMCLISDRHQDILKAVERLPDFQPPKGVHRFCLRHVASNLNTHFNNVMLKDLCWQAGTALTVREFDNIMKQIKLWNPDGYEYLAAIDRSRWTLCYDEGKRCGVKTTNMSECLNGVLKGVRHLPIAAVVRLTFTRSNKCFVDRQRAAVLTQQKNKMWPNEILKKFGQMHRIGLKYIVEPYDYLSQTANVITQVEGSKHTRTFKVTLTRQECSCGEWKNYGIPCSHAMQVCIHFMVDPAVFVKSYYSTNACVMTYSSGVFEPLPDDDEWDEPSFRLKHNPERRIKHRGRAITSGIENETDWRQRHGRQQYFAHGRAETSQCGSSVLHT